MLAHGLQAVGLPIGIVALHGYQVAVDEVFHLVLRDVVRALVAQHAARAYVVVVVEQLRGVGQYDPLRVDLVERVVRLVLQPHIIKVGGQHDVELAEGVDHPLLLVGVELVLLFLYAAQPSLRPLAVVVEVLVARLPLAEPHELDVAHEQLHLVVGGGPHALQHAVGPLVVHVGDVDKGQRVDGLGLPAAVVSLPGQTEGLAGVGPGLAQVAVALGVGQGVQLVHLIVVGGCTSRKQQGDQHKARQSRRKFQMMSRAAQVRFRLATAAPRVAAGYAECKNTLFPWVLEIKGQIF